MFQVQRPFVLPILQLTAQLFGTTGNNFKTHTVLTCSRYVVQLQWSLEFMWRNAAHSNCFVFLYLSLLFIESKDSIEFSSVGSTESRLPWYLVPGTWYQYLSALMQNGYRYYAILHKSRNDNMIYWQFKRDISWIQILKLRWWHFSIYLKVFSCMLVA